MFNSILTSYSLFPTKVCSLSDELKLSILKLSVVLLIVMKFFSFLVILLNIIKNSNKYLLIPLLSLNIISDNFVSSIYIELESIYTVFEYMLLIKVPSLLLSTVFMFPEWINFIYFNFNLSGLKKFLYSSITLLSLLSVIFPVFIIYIGSNERYMLGLFI